MMEVNIMFFYETEYGTSQVCFKHAVLRTVNGDEDVRLEVSEVEPSCNDCFKALPDVSRGPDDV
jgi:hypothetical protein